jgi:hypothetical protein
MQRWMMIPIGLVGIFILITLFEMPMNAIHNISTDEQTDAGLVCVSSPEDVVLTVDLWQDDILSVVSGVDNLGHVLTPTAYVPATNTLTVTGWVTPAATCTIVYEYDALTEWTGFGPVVAFSPMLLWLAMMGACGFMVIAGAMSFKG